jgi:hypothetical protein
MKSGDTLGNINISVVFSPDMILRKFFPQKRGRWREIKKAACCGGKDRHQPDTSEGTGLLNSEGS